MDQNIVHLDTTASKGNFNKVIENMITKEIKEAILF